MGLARWQVKKTANGGYQKWSGYPDSLDLSDTYQFQLIVAWGTDVWLIVSTAVISLDNNNFWFSTGNYKRYNLTSGAWVYSDSGANSSIIYYLYYGTPAYIPIESNADTYTNMTLTDVMFSKTTTPAQDAGILENISRINT